jgi:hypothetical protein
MSSALRMSVQPTTGKPGMPLSNNPSARRTQLANLRKAPPAPTGHTRANKDGFYATAKTLPVEGKARLIAEELASESPLRDGDGDLPMADRAAIELTALCLCRIESIEHYLQLHGELDEKGNLRPATEHARRLRSEAKDHLSALGMTTRSRIALGLDLQRGAAADFATLLADLPDEDGPADA